MKMNNKMKEKLVLDALGVKVGDFVEVTFYDAGNHHYTRVYEIIENDENYLLESNISATRSITVLIYYNFKKKRTTKGTLICNEATCEKCPLQPLKCDLVDYGDSLYVGLAKIKEVKEVDDKVYSFFKGILDEEIE